MAKKKNHGLPDEVLVQWYGDKSAYDPRQTYLIANEDDAAANDADCGENEPGSRVGVYKLVDVVKIEKDEKFTRKRM